MALLDGQIYEEFSRAADSNNVNERQVKPRFNKLGMGSNRQPPCSFDGRFGEANRQWYRFRIKAVNHDLKILLRVGVRISAR